MITLEERDVAYLYLNLKTKYMGVSMCMPEEINDFSRKLMNNKDIMVLVVDDSNASDLVNSGNYISVIARKIYCVNKCLEYVYLKLFLIIETGYLMDIFLQVLKKLSLPYDLNKIVRH